MTESLSTLRKNDTIVLFPTKSKISHYSGLSYDFFMMDGYGPFPVVKNKRLRILRDEDGEFEAFEWIELLPEIKSFD